jgi:hypothetical protein
MRRGGGLLSTCERKMSAIRKRANRMTEKVSFTYLASAKALLQCLSALRLSVSRPCNSKKAPNRFKAGPRSRSIYYASQLYRPRATITTKQTSVRTLIANAIGPNVSLNFIPWYPSEGSVNPGNLPDFVQSNLPKSQEKMLQSGDGMGTAGRRTGIDDDSSDCSSVATDPLRCAVH